MNERTISVRTPYAYVITKKIKTSTRSEPFAPTTIKSDTLIMEDNRVMTPQSTSASSVSSSKTPFDWLQGSLFFGGVKSSNTTCNTTKEYSGPDSTTDDHDYAMINSSKDAFFLLNGVSENLSILVSLSRQQRIDITNTTSESNVEMSTVASTSATGSTATSETTTISTSDKIVSNLSRLRFLLYDERRVTSQHNHSTESTKLKPLMADTTIHAMTGNQLQQLIPSLLEHMALLPFESRKHVAAIFNYLLVCGLEGIDATLYTSVMMQFVSYILANYERIMTLVVQGHDLSRIGITPDIALHFGSMYRCSTRHPTLYQQLVGTREAAQQFVFPFLDNYVHVANFEISSDAMESLRAAFAANTDRVIRSIQDNQAEQYDQFNISDIAAEFLYRDYDAIWDDRFTPKLLSGTANYISRRIALQILSTVLLTRSNYSTMIRYVSSRSNLIVIMQLLRDTSPHITMDAFHVFKVFVANPNKPPEILKILHDNKAKLCAYLTTLHQEKEEIDTQFRDEKALIIATIDAQ
jgi:calcium binding protein 39